MAALENIVTIGDPANPLFVFRNMEEGTDRDGIGKIGGMFAMDVAGDELSIDTVTAIVQYSRPPLPAITEREIYVSPGNEIYLSPGDEIYYALISNEKPITPKGDIRTIPYGTPFRWECDGRLIASFYCKQPVKIGRYLWRLTAVSGVGLLDNLDHVGGVYTGQTFETVVGEIIGGAFPFTVAPALADQEVYNWLPYDSRRNNLHRLLVSLGASMRRDAIGETAFVFLSAADPAPVPDTRVSIGGSVDYDAPATRYEVTEHAFFISSSDETETLYDNTTGGTLADHTLVKFGGNAPVHSLLTTGTLSIDESGVNYARVSGVGTLTGKRYTHTTRIVAANVENPTGEENVKHLRDDITLISLANSRNVAKRMLAYYSGARRVRASLVLDGERCGDVLNLHDPFFDPMTAFLAAASVNASSNLLASCELVEGYVPTNQGNNVTGSETLYGIGTWVSPITGTLTVAVIAGGRGGSAGSAGEAAPVPSISSYSADFASVGGVRAYYLAARNARAGAGGQPGTPGNGGKVYITTVEVVEGQEIAYSCGVGGAGEIYGSGTGGRPGTATTFGEISSDQGAVYPAGYPDPINGDLLAASGDDGVAGSEGVGFKLNENGIPYLFVPEPIVADGTSYSAGAQGNTASAGPVSSSSRGQFAYNAIGGYGGGAAYKAAGHRGTDGSGGGSGSSWYASPGPGGDGADAQPAPRPTVPGKGGAAGNGGGGGGAYGTSYKSNGANEYLQSGTWIENRNELSSSFGSITLSVGTSARGGKGSDGTQGADGAVRLFWGG